jgi:probable rRNA maturation factor
MRIINYEYRDIDTTTDVLSFPSEPFPQAPLGSIIISINKVEQMAQKLGHSIHEEMTLLFIHGMLHLLGMDHEVDNGEMRLREEEIVTALGLSASLIVRTMEE